MDITPAERPSSRSPAPSGAQYLRIAQITVYVSDLERSLRFYIDLLGFRQVYDGAFEGLRWVAVSPPDGAAVLSIVAPQPGDPAHKFVGKGKSIAFIAEDVHAIYRAWTGLGVRFRHSPITPVWGGVFTSFLDPDGNEFAIVGFDEVTRTIEAERAAAVEKLEAERRAVHDMEIAKQVQARLFPQQAPPCRTLDYAGVCRQAREVGGDYYDFLQLAGDRLILAVGDIAGKSIAGALLMANLQANLRSQCAIALEQPRKLLSSVNQLFFENTASSAYATLFFADYHDATQTLTYANCGHLPALLMRANGSLERLPSTSTVLGLFAHWDCTIEQRRLAPGDTLLLYTDGVTEAENQHGEEFGENRLASALRSNNQHSAAQTIGGILDAVKRFSPHEQQDDITLIAARCRTA